MKQSGFTTYEVIGLIIAIIGIIGYVWNIVKFVGGCCEPITGMLVIRAIGIFLAPLGIVVGYM